MALNLAQHAIVGLIVSHVDPIDHLDRLREILPIGYAPVDALQRAKEMLQDWDKYATPDVLRNIQILVDEKRDHLAHMVGGVE